MKRIRERDIRDIFALTPIQEGLLFHYLKDPGSDHYFEQLCLEMSGVIKLALFERAWNFVIESNEMLRTTFRWEKVENPIQIVLEEYTLEPAYYDFSMDTPHRGRERLEEVKVEDRKEKFNLFDVPFRVTLCKIEDARFEMIISNHHILYDGWSSGIILKEFFDVYSKLAGGDALIKPGKTGYKEFVKWIGNLDTRKQEKFWKDYLNGFETPTRLPAGLKKKERETGTDTGGSQVGFGKGVLKKIEDFTVSRRLTPASLFYSAWGILLQRYTNSGDVIFGTTVSGRSAKVRGIENIVGLFINTLPLRVQTEPHERISELLHRIDKTLQVREEYEAASLVDIKEWSDTRAGEELFDSIVVLENYPLDAMLISGNNILNIDSYNMREAAHYDLTVGITVFDRIELNVTYNKEQLDKSTVETVSGHFRCTLEYILQNPGKETGDIEIITEAEKNRLLYTFNDTAVDYPEDTTIPDLLESRAEKTPDKIAVTGKGVGKIPRLSYRELNRKAGLVAAFLREKGLEPGGIVGIKIERSMEMIVGIWGILKAGGAYLPIDPGYPEERTRYILVNSGAKLLLTGPDCGAALTGDGPFNSPGIPSSNPVYVIYTSGSTGRPKGVMLEHRSVVNRLNWMQRFFPLGENDVILQKTPFVFDVSVWELFWWVIPGASVCLLGHGEEKDPEAIIKAVNENSVTTLHFVPSMLNAFLEYIESACDLKALWTLRQVFASGEALRIDGVKTFNRLLNRNNGTKLINLYGPTEAAVDVTYFKCFPGENYQNIPIGKPIDNIEIHILDRTLNLQPLHLAGELCISGVGVARGYVNNIELTNKAFVFHPFAPGKRLYRTGDLACRLPDGNIRYLGRMDHQVKIRGFRVELGEIENKLTDRGDVKEAVVVIKKDRNNESYLFGYYVSDKEIPLSDLRDDLSRQLPDYMVPADFARLQRLPLTRNGKVDRKRLPVPGESRAVPGHTHVVPRTGMEKIIADAWKHVLKIESVGVDDNFFDLGGNSLYIIRLSSKLKEVLKRDVPVVTLFNFPTVSAQARYFGGPDTAAGAREEGAEEEAPGETAAGSDIAVIGMAGRFPGARNIDEFWDNLKHGIESVSFFSDHELEALGVDPERLGDPNYVKAKAVLDDCEDFDASFFEYTGAESELMDPQTRVFHQCAWEALENAGYDPHSYTGRIGLYAGATPNLFWEMQAVFSRRESLSFLEQWEAVQFSNKDYISTRISYKLNLRGPGVTVQTACSTSLVAIDLACQGLLSKKCDMSLAGGVSITFHDKGGYSYHQGMIMSPDGHCRVFDEKAEGTVNGNGAGVVLLKPLEKAIADRDNIYAVIRGSAVNNDGIVKVGFTAPGVEGQVGVIRQAQRAAGVEPESINYIETHGTGTVLGDPIEIEALKSAFNSRKKGFCAIGSVKSNVGHLDAAAGVAGFIKTVLAINHRMIPPALHFQRANPKINFKDSPFYVNTLLKAWENHPYPLRAAVSSFGIGGTNAHVILEEPPTAYREERSKSSAGPRPELIVLSAVTPTALKKQAENLGHYLKENPVDIADVAYTLRVGRKAFQHRTMLVCPDINHAVNRLIAGDMDTFSPGKEKRRVVFLFSGQGAQYVNMGRELYRSDEVFREKMDRCFDILVPVTECDLRAILYPGDDGDRGESAGEINRTNIAQPLLFAFEYALAHRLMEWGIIPHAMMGHSIGEYTAACLAGVFSLEDALTLVALRGRLMGQMPSGSMLGVPLPGEEVLSMLNADLSLAAVNSPSTCVVSGPNDAVDTFAGELEAMGHRVRRLHTSHAFHSRMMEPILVEFEAKVKGVKRDKPGIAYISNLTGNWITVEEAVDPGYWSRQLRGTVQFSAGVETLREEGNLIFVEVGPGNTLSTFIKQHRGEKNSGDIPLAINTVRHPKENVPDDSYLLSKIGQLWLYGLDMDGRRFFAGEKRYRIPLPTYPFEGKQTRAEQTAGQNGTGARPNLSTPYAAPGDQFQRSLADTWEKLLGFERIGIRDNFFELGGDSLKAAVLISKIRSELNVEIKLKDFFAHPTIEGLAGHKKDTGESVPLPLEPMEEKEYYPLSSAQKRMYILNQLESESTGYNVTAEILCEGQLDMEKMAAVFRALIKRHESLRTSFIEVENEPVQKIHAFDEIEFDIEYRRPFPAPGFIRPFDLSRAPLLRVGVIKIEEEKLLLMVDMHHIIVDGFSQAVFTGDIIALYEGKEPPRLKVQYKDYAQWQNRKKETGLIQKHEDYWLKLFEGEIPVLDLPMDYARPVVQSFEGSRLDFEIGVNETRALKTLALGEGATLYMVLLALYNIFLSKLSNKEDIPVGTAAAGRIHPDLEPVMGMFVNTLALRNFPRGEITFKTFLADVRKRTLEAFQNQDYPFEDLVSKLAINRDAGRNSLFDVMFTLNNIGGYDLDIPGLKLTRSYDEDGTSKFDLDLAGVEKDENLLFFLQYDTKLFKEETILRFIDYFKNIVFSVLNEPGQTISSIEILSDEERKRVLYEFNDTPGLCPKDKTLPELFDEQVKRSPDRTAVCFQLDLTDIYEKLNSKNGKFFMDSMVKIGKYKKETQPRPVYCSLTYRELDERSNRLAASLMERGGKWGGIVGVKVERSPEMIVALLGILKAGGAYLPIDPGYPQERIDYMLKDSAANLVLTEGAIIEAVQRTQRTQPTHPTRLSHPHDLAYVLYTSGSIGRPKGVLVEHGNVVRLVKNSDFIDFSEGDRLLLTGSLVFDITTFEIWGSLLNGLSLYLVHRDVVLDAEKLKGVLWRNSINILHLVPQVFAQLAESPGGFELFAALDCFLVGGDLVRPGHINRLRETYHRLNILHMYGPTENTTFSTCYPMDRTFETRIPIGKPISDSTAYIVGPGNRVQPVGFPGELWVGGEGVARGYLNKSELTAERFNFNNRFYNTCTPLYRTGDLARWLADGNIEFLGRIDHQVKIKGIRIEPGEIENRLLKHEQIKGAVVLAKENPAGDKYLCAYIVPVAAAAKMETSGLRRFLSESVPDNMIPSVFVQLDTIPLNINGKVDRKALPEPEIKSREEYAEPRGEVENILAETWSQVLGTRRIGINDNFFEVGGDSIKAVQITSKMHGAGYKVTLKDIFRYPVISELAPVVVKIESTADQSVLSGIVPLTPTQEMFFRENGTHPSYFNQAVMLYSERGFDRDTVKTIFTQIQAHHDTLRMTFKKGPNGIVQRIHHLDYPFFLDEYDLRKQENAGALLKIKADEIQAGIDLETGPLMRLAIFHMDDGGRLLIVIHHLVIDGLSWRILFEDFGTLTKQLENGEPPVLPLKTDSFKLWSENLVTYSTGESLLNQAAYWKDMETKQVFPLKRDGDGDRGGNPLKDMETVSFHLAPEYTGRLLTGVHHAFGTEINDILLTALGSALQKSFGVEHLAIALEGHGREDIIEGIDVSRTMGWFTSLYPVVLDFSYNGDMARQLKEVKETLRRVPDKGIGYGILRYLTPGEKTGGLKFKLRPRVTFNYLGEFDSNIRGLSVRMAEESVGRTESENLKIAFDLEISGVIMDNRLSVAIRFNKRVYSPGTIRDLSDLYRAELQSVISYCAGRKERVLTPSDLAYKALSVETLDRLCSQYALEDIYSLSPMQEGMLFYALYDPDSNMYLDQTSYRMNKEIDLQLVEKSLKELFKRHDALRTVFIHEGIDRPVQLVLKPGEREVGIYYEDIRGIGGSEEKEAFIHSFKIKNRESLFDIGGDVLLRLSIIRCGEAEYEFIWTSPHIVMDGWSKTILITEYTEIYDSFLENRKYLLPPAQSYGVYIKWLENLDENRLKHYWKKYLEGYETPAVVPETKNTGPGETIYRDEEVEYVMESGKMNRLKEFSAKNQLTLNIIFQTIWAIILARYNETQDVAFGIVVSGRPAEIKGVESMVGLFINTIPVRIRFREQTKFIDLLHSVRDDAFKTGPYHFVPLAEIQAQSKLKQNLLNHIFAFENYPTASLVESEKITVNEEFAQLSNYQFNVVIEPGEQFRVILGYNAERYDRHFVEKLSGHIDDIVNKILENDSVRVEDIQLSTGVLEVDTDILKEDCGEFQF